MSRDLRIRALHAEVSPKFSRDELWLFVICFFGAGLVGWLLGGVQ